MEETTARGGRRRLSQAIALALGLTAMTAAMSQTTAFDVPGQEAATAIPEFARQAGLQIIAPADKLKGVKTQSLHGAIDTRAALKLLLVGTGLIVASDDGHTISLRFSEVAGNTTSKLTPAAGSGRLAAASDTFGSAGQTSAANPQSSDAAQNGDLGEIVVTGIRASITSARAIKRDAQGIVDAIAPEDIGKLPDTNLAESLQRITGVSIDRSGGEGEFITVRGFGPEFNTVLVNRRQIATATDPSQASGRAFSFDTLASELVSGVEVYKSSTAHLQSGGVGATVNIKTARPFDYSGFKFSGSADMNHDQNSGKSAPDASFLVSDLFADGTLGALLSGSYQKRKDELKAATTDGWIVNGGTPISEINGGAGVQKTASNPQGNIFVPQDFGSQAQFETRERIGGTVVLQYKPSDALTLTSDTLYSKFTNTTDTRSYGHWFTASNLSNVVTDGNGTAIDMTQGIGQASDFHDKKYDKKTDLTATGLNADWNISDSVNLNVDGSYSSANEDPNGGKESELALLGYLGQTIRYRSDGSILPYATGYLQNAAGVVGDSNPLFQHVMLLRGYGVKDTVAQMHVDFTYKGDSPSEGLAFLHWGGFFSRDKKDTSLYSNDGGTGCTTCGYNNPAPPNVPIGVFNLGSNFLSGVSGANRLPTQWLTFDGQTLFNAITAQQQLINPGFSFAPPRVNNSVVIEKVFGGYLDAQFAGSLAGRKFTTVVGVRVEDTQATIDGLATQFVALTKLANDQTQYGVTDSGKSTVGSSSHYTDILPTMSFRWDVTDALVARFAASETMTRPTLEQLSPVTTLVTLRPGNFAAASGNPDLKPFRSNNLDLSVEYYYDKSNYVSFGLFYKNVSNFIVLNQSTGPVNNAAKTPLIDPGTGLPAQFTITAPQNGPTAVVTGEEMAIQQSFGETGLGVQLNGTLANSDKKLSTSDLTNKFAVTGLSNSANAVLFYDKGSFEARAAVNWRDHFLQYLSPPPLNGAGQAVTQVRARYQLDASATYHINKNFAVFAEGVNLTNTLVLKYAYYQNQFMSAEDSGTRFKVGFRASF